MLRSEHQILNRKSQIVNRRSDKFDFCRESSTNSPFSCKTNPISKNPQYALSSFSTKAYGKNARFSPAKANPNKPKQSQSDPHFSPVRAYRSQNEPKQTQSKPNFLIPGRTNEEISRIRKITAAINDWIRLSRPPMRANITGRQIFFSSRLYPEAAHSTKRSIPRSFYGTVTLSVLSSEIHSSNPDNFLDLSTLIRYNSQLKGRENQAGTPTLC